MKLLPAWTKADLPNLVSLFTLIDEVKLLNEMLRNLRVVSGGKSEGKLPVKLLFDKSKW